MTLFRLTLVLVFASLMLPAQEPGTLAFTKVRVVDLAKGTVGSPATIVVRNGRIESIADEAPPASVTVVDVDGQFAIPGLWDMHVHLGEAGPVHLPLMIANGVTHVRDMGGDMALIDRWREAIEGGTLVGPQIYAAGPILESPRTIERFKELLKHDLPRIGVGTPEEADGALTQLAALGVDFAKIRTTHSPEAYRAIIAEARKRGLSVVGHLPTGLTVLEASEAGQRSIEHMVSGPGIRPFKGDLPELCAALVKNGTYITPTLVAGVGFRLTPDEVVMKMLDDPGSATDTRIRYAPQSAIGYWREQMDLKSQERPKFDWAKIYSDNAAIFKAMHKAGVSLLVGSDLGGPLVYPGFSVHEELALLANEVGMSPEEALACATANPARFFGIEKDYGAVAVGKMADFVLLDKNPLKEIENTKGIQGVVVQGRWLDQAALEGLLKKAEEDAGKS